MPDLPEHRSQPSRLDPNLTILPAISAPIDQGLFIPKPRPNRWDRLLRVGLVVVLAAAVLAYAFLHATPMR